jgi:hypothetical protein
MLHKAPSGVGLEQNVHKLPLVRRVGVRRRRNLLLAECLEGPLETRAERHELQGIYGAQSITMHSYPFLS